MQVKLNVNEIKRKNQEINTNKQKHRKYLNECKKEFFLKKKTKLKERRWRWQNIN